MPLKRERDKTMLYITFHKEINAKQRSLTRKTKFSNMYNLIYLFLRKKKKKRKVNLSNLLISKEKNNVCVTHLKVFYSQSK